MRYKKITKSFCQIHFLFHYFITLQNRKFGIYLIKVSILLWIIFSFFLNNIFCRNQYEANEPQINPLERKLIDSDPPPPPPPDTPRKRHNSGHKVGFHNN